MQFKTRKAALSVALAVAGVFGVATAVFAHGAGGPPGRGGMCGGGMGPRGGHGREGRAKDTGTAGGSGPRSWLRGLLGK
jgi:hypothetical protein